MKFGNWSSNIDHQTPSSLCRETWNDQLSHIRKATRPSRLTCAAPKPPPGGCVTGLSLHKKSVSPFIQFLHLNLSSTCFPLLSFCPPPTMNVPPFYGLDHIFIFTSKRVGAQAQHPLHVFRSAHVRDGFPSMKPPENSSGIMRNGPVSVKWRCVTSTTRQED